MILFRERAKVTKLEGDFKKRKGVLMDESNRTITFLPPGRSQTTIISKREVGNWDQQPCCSKWLINEEVPETQQQTKPRELPKPEEVTTPEEMTIPEEMANQQSTATTTTNELTNHQSQEKATRGTIALKALKQRAKETKRSQNQNTKTQKTGTNSRRSRI